MFNFTSNNLSLSKIEELNTFSSEIIKSSGKIDARRLDKALENLVFQGIISLMGINCKIIWDKISHNIVFKKMKMKILCKILTINRLKFSMSILIKIFYQ